MKHRSLFGRSVALATLASFVASSCGGGTRGGGGGGGPAVTAGSGSSPLSDRVLVQNKDLPPGLELRLSDGTQEQIAILVRLAMGTMLVEQGHVVPIILDDALVYCDDDRIRRMFDALSRAGRKQQVIVLTCRLRTFSPLGGRALRIETSPPHAESGGERQ